MEKRETWAVLVAAAAVVTSLLSLGGLSQFTEGLISSGLWEVVLRSGLSFLANLVVGAWLFVEARKSGASPWVWAMAGVVFSLMAAVLFFVIRRTDSQPA